MVVIHPDDRQSSKSAATDQHKCPNEMVSAMNQHRISTHRAAAAPGTMGSIVETAVSSMESDV